MKTEHTFYIGDCFKILKKIEDETIQLVITSPPYWNAKDYKNIKQLGYKDTYGNYIKKLSKILNELERVLLPDGKIAINIGNIYNHDLTDNRYYTVNLSQEIWNLLKLQKSLRYMGTIYWKKSTSRNGAVLFGSYPYPSNIMISTALEPIHIFRKIGKRKKIEPLLKEKSILSKSFFRKIREPIWHLNGLSQKEHPAVFPKELARRLILMYSFYGDTILDPFCGVGTTNKQAHAHNRNSIGIDINYNYLKNIIKEFKINKTLLKIIKP